MVDHLNTYVPLPHSYVIFSLLLQWTFVLLHIYREELTEKKQGNQSIHSTPGPYDVEDDAPEGDVYDGYRYDDGESWKLQTCTNLIFLAGTGNSSMLPEHLA